MRLWDEYSLVLGLLSKDRTSYPRGLWFAGGVYKAQAKLLGKRDNYLRGSIGNASLGGEKKRNRRHQCPEGDFEERTDRY